MTRRGAAAALLLALLPALATAAAAPADAIPRPHGWIGTANDWARGLGIGFVLLDALILFAAVRIVSRTGLTSAAKWLLLVGVGVLPLSIVFFGYSYGLEASKEVDACGSCHVMKPYVADLRDPKSETLAALHFKNRYIFENHCYTCHTDYGMYGTVKAKVEGLGHVVRYTTGAYETPLKIAHPYSNLRCLNCHGASQKFLLSEGHPPEDRVGMIRDETSCLECHGPAHPRPAQKASR